MIDHLLTFATENAAKADSTVGTYWIASDDQGNPGSWRGDVCIPGVSVYTISSSVRTYLPGWFIVISRPALDTALRDVGGGTACVLIADRDAANRGDANFILYAPGLSQQQLAATYVEPTFAGSNYPFGVG